MKEYKGEPPEDIDENECYKLKNVAWISGKALKELIRSDNRKV